MISARNRPAGLDLVIPVFNEEEVLEMLFERLEHEFAPEQLARHGLHKVRFIFVDDGSVDRTAGKIAERIRAGFPAVLIRLTRNFGHQSAVTAGLANSDADLTAVIDADLQDPPKAILEMLALWREGYDVIYGQRRKRKEGPFKVFCYWLYYRILSFLSENPVAMDSGDFSLMDRRVVQAMNALPEKLRFPRGLRSWVGFRQVGYAYERDARRAGSSKYSLQKLYYLATDGIASLSIRPLKVAQFCGIAFLLISAVLTGISLYKWLTYSRQNSIPLWFFATFVLISLGHFMTLLSIYVMSAYIGRTYLEVKGRPNFLILETIRRDADAQ